MNLSRRTILKAAGVSLALPALAAENDKRKGKPPVRTFFIALGYGVTAQKWFPAENEGNNYKMPEGLMPLNSLRKDFTVVQNLSNHGKPSPHGSSRDFLSNGEVHTCDQQIGEIIGKETRFQTLELASAKKQGGHGDMSLARDTQGNVLPPISGPLQLYLTMYGSPNRNIDTLRKNLAKEKSLLDILKRQRQSFSKNLGKEDTETVEEYYSSIRSLEKKLSRAEKWLKVPLPKAKTKPPAGELNATQEIRATYDLLALAFQADLSRVATYLHPIDSIFKELGIEATPHNMSHYGKSPELLMPISLQRDQFNSNQLAYLIKRLKATKDWDGSSVFDNSIVAYGTPVRWGHSCKNGPMIITGKGGGKIKQGQNIVYKKDITPLSDLWYSLIKSLDPQVKKFANSKRFMSELFVS